MARTLYNKLFDDRLPSPCATARSRSFQRETSSSQRAIAMDAPASFSLGAMGPLLRKLDSFLVAPEFRLPKPLKDGIELLKEDVEEISGDLQDQTKVDSPSHKSRYWMDEVRDLSYHIEDCIDTMMLLNRPCSSSTNAKPRSARGHKVHRVKIRGSSMAPKPRAAMAMVAELRALVREAGERRGRYQLDLGNGGCCSSSCSSSSHGRVPVPSSTWIAADDLVGMDEPKATLARMITDEAALHMKVVCVLGSAGVGKTTLAQQVYRKLGWQFECRAFVRVSRIPDTKRLLGEILSQVQPSIRMSDTSTVQSLIDNLREYLQKKR